MVAYLYVRFSTKRQSKGNSEARQVGWAKKWCKKNDVQLDEQRDYADRGCSSYRGKNRTKGGLSRFLAACERGEIKPGSVLIVESLDRLSRENQLQGLKLIEKLVTDLGITLVTIAPEYRFEKGNLDLALTILAHIEFARANSESAVKSFRSKDNWEKKRARAMEKKMSKRSPGWLTLVGNEWQVDPGKAALVRRIFGMVRKGYGLRQVARILTEEGLEPLGTHSKARRWYCWTLSKLIHSDAVFGVFQPKMLQDGRFVPAGDAIQDYFPVVVPEAEALAARQAIRTREKLPGGNVTKVSNLFTGLVYQGKTSLTYYAPNGKNSYLIGGKMLSYPPFERALLFWLHDIHLVQSDSEIPHLERQKEGLEQRIAAVAKQLDVDPDFTLLLGKLSEYKKQLQEVTQRLDLATPVDSLLVHGQELIRLLETAADRTELRRELRQNIQQMVGRIDVSVGGQKGDRLIDVVVLYRDGRSRKVYYREQRGKIVETGFYLKEGGLEVRSQWHLFPFDANPTEELRRACQRLRAEGLSYAKIGKRLGVNSGRVFKLLQK